MSDRTPQEEADCDEDYPDEDTPERYWTAAECDYDTKVDLGGGMIVSLTELMEDENPDV